MKLSIIVPVYDVEEYLKECIESILRQRHEDFELILVDDGSTDLSGTVCDEYAEKDDRIRVIHRPNGGLSAARNTGLDAVQGDYIAFVDADDHVGKEFFARAMKLVEAEGKPDIVEMPIEVYYNSPDKRELYPSVAGEDMACQFPQSWTTWIGREGLTHTYACNKVYRNKLFRKRRFPEGRVFEDLHTVPQLMKRARSIVFCNSASPDERYYYRFRKSSITTAATYRSLNDAMRHHNHLMSELIYTTGELPTPCIDRYFLKVTNVFIDLLRHLDGETFRNEEQQTLIRKAEKFLQRLCPPTHRLMQAADRPRHKLKNLPLALFGLRVHCFLYSGKWIPAPKKK